MTENAPKTPDPWKLQRDIRVYWWLIARYAPYQMGRYARDEYAATLAERLRDSARTLADAADATGRDPLPFIHLSGQLPHATYGDFDRCRAIAELMQRRLEQSIGADPLESFRNQAQVAAAAAIEFGPDAAEQCAEDLFNAAKLAPVAYPDAAESVLSQLPRPASASVISLAEAFGVRLHSPRCTDLATLEAVGALAEAIIGEVLSAPAPTTPAEPEARGVVQGYTQKHLAKELGVSDDTIRKVAIDAGLSRRKAGQPYAISQLLPMANAHQKNKARPRTLAAWQALLDRHGLGKIGDAPSARPK